MFEFTRNFYSPEGIPIASLDESSESSFTPGEIIIPEQSVTVASDLDAELQAIIIDTDPPEKLLISFDNNNYEVLCTNNFKPTSFDYGDRTPEGEVTFGRYPFFIAFNRGLWHIATSEPGTYTVSAKVPEVGPKVLSFPKGRTIVSELSRLNKAFGTISTKKTIIGQLSDIADAAEAGKIGGGSGGAFMVHANGKDTPVLDKTWQEIYDALKTTSVYIINENEEDTFVTTANRIISASYSDNTYRVNDDNSGEFTTDSPDGYPAGEGKA